MSNHRFRLEVLFLALERYSDGLATHGAEIKDLDGLGIYVLAFRDPDNIQVELTAPKG